MFFHVYCADIVKEFFFNDILDGRFTIHIYAAETGLDQDILFPLYISNGVWKLVPRTRLQVISEKSIEREYKIVHNKEIIVLLPNGKKIVLFPFKNDVGSLQFSKYHMGNLAEISIGRTEKNLICFDHPLISSDHAVISYKDRKTYVCENGKPVYVNGKMIKGTVRIRFGDTVFIQGLKVIHLGGILAVNSPNGNVRCRLDKFKESRIKATETEVRPLGEDDLPEAETFFSRSPRITKPLEHGKIDIDPPPPGKNQRQMPLIMTIGPSATMGMGMLISLIITITLSMNGNGSLASISTGAVTTSVMLLGAILWPLLVRNYQEKRTKEDEIQRDNRYRSYIANMDILLQQKTEFNQNVLKELYPPVELCFSRCFNIDRRLWERSPQNEDFLDIRIGVGARESQLEVNIPKERFSLEDDPLKNEMSLLKDKYKYISNVPLTVNLAKNRLVGLIGDRERIEELAISMTVHLTALHSYDEVKLCYIYDSKSGSSWDFAKWLPHVFTKNRKLRLMINQEDELHAVLTYLEGELDDRKARRKELGADAEKANAVIPHYILFVENMQMIERERVLRRIIDEGAGVGFSIVFLCDRIDKLPNICNVIIQYTKSESSVYDKNDKDGMMQLFVPDNVKGQDLVRYAKKLFSVRVMEQSEDAGLPNSLTFMEMYRAGRIEDLIIPQRWEQSRPYQSLEAPLGVADGAEVFSLNIHEKFHGPHGLIAGTTGSGKSEFIQSYILSMVINYHPYDVSFILIDYKGGGMANCFKGMPHIAGTITNLGGNQVRRSLVTLKSELKRRQTIFSDANVNHIDKYQQMYKSKNPKAIIPLPHLIIISDEFAELKSQQPDFMRELVSTARIGRSLGVHLVLATQKPSGVVDEQIWSNTRFRACLKVNDKMESNEMLKRPEASTITQPGRGYIQVGNNELFKLIQSGWSGAPYIPSSKITVKSDESVSMIGLNGLIKLSAADTEEVEGDTQTQLDAIVSYIIEFSARNKITPLTLWLPSLEDIVRWEDLEKLKPDRNGGFTGTGWTPANHWLQPIVGMYDDPSTQSQGMIIADIGNEGHLALYGAPTTGKTTFLQTLVYALAHNYSPELVNMYILDFGGRAMEYMRILPHVGDIIFSDDEERISKLFKLISKELNSRKRLFADYGVGSIKSYMEASGKTLPAIILVLDNYAAFSEIYPDFEADMVKISREGSNFGIYQVLTGSNSNAIKYKVMQNYKLMYALQLNDRFDYINIVGQTEGLEPESVKGRGLAKLDYPVEFQTAIVMGISSDAERVKKIREVFMQMNECWQGARAKPIPYVPENLTLDEIINNNEYLDVGRQRKIPIGYDVEEADLQSVGLNEQFVFTVLGRGKSGKTDFIRSLIQFTKVKYNWGLYVCDNEEGTLSEACKKYGVGCYANDTEKLTDMANEIYGILDSRKRRYKELADSGASREALRDLVDSFEPMLILIDDFMHFFALLSDPALELFVKVLKGMSGLNAMFIVSSCIQGLNAYGGAPIYKAIFTGQNGLLLGGDFSMQSIYKLNLNFSMQNVTYQAGQGFLIRQDSLKIVKTQHA